MHWIVTIIVALFSGGVASLIAPWVHWPIEKRRTEIAYKQKLIQQ